MIFDKKPISMGKVKERIKTEKSYGWKIKYHRKMPVEGMIQHWLIVLNTDGKVLLPYVIIPQSNEELDELKQLCDFVEDDAPHFSDNFPSIDEIPSEDEDIPPEEIIDPSSYEMNTLDGENIPVNNSIVPPETRGFKMPEDTKSIAIQSKLQQEGQEQ